MWREHVEEDVKPAEEPPPRVATCTLDDVRATAAYRSALIPTLVRRSLDAIRTGATDHQWPGRVPCLVGDMPPGTSERRIGRHRQHPGVSPAREDDNGVQCSGRNGIACVFDRPVGLGGGVVAERGLTDAHPNTLSSSSTGTTLARRTACMIG